jgi:hypothetical protein
MNLRHFHLNLLVALESVPSSAKWAVNAAVRLDKERDPRALSHSQSMRGGPLRAEARQSRTRL